MDELEPEQAVPVLREYHRRSRVTHSFFAVDASSSDAEWRAAAPRHPVFRLRRE